MAFPSPCMRGWAIAFFASVPLLFLGASDPAPGLRSLNSPPDLLSFSWQATGSGTYLCEGQVSDEYPESCTVYFGGVLSGHSTFAFADGTFSYAVSMPTYEGGAVSAQAFDEFDQSSEVLWDSISTNGSTGTFENE